MNRLHTRYGIGLRITLLVCSLVLAAAWIVFFGVERHIDTSISAERSSRYRFLAESLSYGIHNILASPGGRGHVAEVVENVLERILPDDPSLIACEVRAAGRGEPVYRFSDFSRVHKGERVRWTRVPVVSAGLKIGSIRIAYVDRNIFEVERTRQILTIANTIASMINTYIVTNDYFQVDNLMRNLVRQDPSILYCYVTDENSRPIFTYRYEKYEKRFNKAFLGRAMSVSPMRPALIQNLGPESDNAVEASLLIRMDGRKVGLLRIGYSLASMKETMRRSRMQLTWATGVLVAAALLLSILVSRSLSSPIRRLTASARSAVGETAGADDDLFAAEQSIRRSIEIFDARSRPLVRRADEVGELARAISSLLLSLQTRMAELKHLYQQMSQTDRLHAMAQLSGGIAHEINNPLTIISTYSQMLLKRDDLDPQSRDDMRIIHEETHRIASKIKELLSFARDTSSEFAPTDLHELLRHVFGLTRYGMKNNKVKLVEHLAAPEPLIIPADRERLRQVFINLILNALQAMPDGGTLTIETAVEDLFAVVSIQDTGSGIPQQNLDRIFDPFFTTKKTGEGTGLGLSVSHGIIIAHGGRIDVDSTPGNGARFRVFLPIESKE